ncbi:MAG TPA: FAD-dependent oxidoreductase [Thermoleophilaceae bacterium]|nr:FAD-dependent oxidoreductase [Thermoleophilaceae bacterium]
MKTDVAIIGGGPAGACAALYLERHGIESTIVEKVPFPRYHIGESTTGESTGILRDLGFGERLEAAGHPHRHGARVFGSGAQPWFVPVMGRTAEGELRDEIAYQLRRSQFDAMLLDEATRHSTLIPGKAVEPLFTDDGAVRGVRVRPDDGGELDLEADLVLDCSGQATFMAARGVTGPKYLGSYDKQIAIFSQVVGYQRDQPADAERERMPGNTHIFYKSKFHWAWVIPLDDEVVSVGVVTPARYFLDQKESKEAFLRRELGEIHEELARRLPTVEFVEDMHAIPNYSFQVRGFAGEGFICVGDAHRFIDPIFSFGLYVALSEAGFAADTARGYLEGGGRNGDLFREHMVRCERGIDMVEDFIDGFWENPLAFSILVHRRYREQMIDVFAGRIYSRDSGPPRVVEAFRELLQRERSYDDDQHLYSVPSGSRFQPERAPLWNARLDSVEATEQWMRELSSAPA